MDVKYSNMQLGDTVKFLKTPGVRVPVTGAIVGLTNNTVTYSDGLQTHTIRRNSLVADRRERVPGGKSHWIFE